MTASLLNSLWRSTLERHLVVSRIVSLNEVRFLRSTESRGKSFIFRIDLLLTGLRFPGQAQLSGDTKVPSILYYDKSGNVRAAGAEVLIDRIVDTAVIEGWTKAEWLVIKHVKKLQNS